MPERFKGTRVGVDTITVNGSQSGSALQFRAVFMSEDGVVHGYRTHKIAVDPERDVDLQAAITNLTRLVVETVERYHYEDGGRGFAARTEVTNGIAEALRGTNDSASDPGEQG